MRHIRILAMILTVVLATVPGVLAAAPEGLTESQWELIREAVAAQTYAIKAAAAGGTYRAENPAHGLRAVFDENGFSAIIQKDGDAVEFSLRPESYGYEDSQITVEQVTALEVEGSRIDLAWDGTLTEWHENGPAGLRQNFTIAKRPSGREGGDLLLTLVPGGGLIPETSDGGVVFKDPAGRPLLSYTGLKAWDAAGRTLPAAMTVSGKAPGAVVVRVDDGNAVYPVTIDPLLARFEFKVTADDGGYADSFGYSVAVSGDVAVVGANEDDDNGYSSGSAYVFERGTDGAWNQTAKLTVDDGSAYDFFGGSVAVSGDTAVVGAYGDDDNGSNSGSAYVFERDSDGAWSQAGKLTAGDGAASDYLGHSVAVSGDVAVAGAYGDDDNGSNSGSAYVFERGTDGAWGQTAKLTAGDGAASDYFGNSVAVSGNTVVVGASGDDDNGSSSGSAYVFGRGVDGAWNQAAKLTAADGAASDNFGRSVAVSGDVVVVGGCYFDSLMGYYYPGSAYVFERGADSAWSQTAKFATNDMAFGFSVAVSGDTAVVGAFLNIAGSAYIFKRGADGAWRRTVKLTADDGVIDDYFGYSVAVSGDATVVGAYGNDDNGSDSGSAYIYDILSIIEQPQAADAAGDGDITAGYPLDITASLDTDHFLVHGGLTGFINGMVAIDGDTGVFHSDVALFPGETATAWLLPGVEISENATQKSSLIWQFTTAAGSSSGVFSLETSFDTGTNAVNGAALGDVDGDGDLDAVMATNGGGLLQLNDGDGIFSDSGQSLGTAVGYAAAFGDVDGDGDLDVVFANASENTVWLNDGDGIFSDSGQSLGSDFSYGLALGDVDGDGDLDLATANTGADTVWLNNGVGTFTDSVQSLATATSFGLVLGDVDLDGDLDLMVAGAGADTVWLNGGGGNFTDSGQGLGSTASYGIALGDVTGDGYPDLSTAGTGGVSVRENDGTGVFGDARVLSGAANGLGLGDVEGDGDLDIMSAAFDENLLWLNDGNGIFSDSEQNLDDAHTVANLPGDLDGDGDLDILSVNMDGAHTVWFNQPAATGNDDDGADDRDTGDDDDSTAASSASGGGGGGCFIGSVFE